MLIANVNNMGRQWYIVMAVAIAAVVIYLIFQNQIRKLVFQIFNGFMNKANQAKINELHLVAQIPFTKLLEAADKLGYDVIITSGRRTLERQSELDDANPANASVGYHPFGLAIDINLVNRKTGKRLRKASSKSDWESTGLITEAKKLGMRWGGDFKNYHDPIHFDLGGKYPYSKLAAEWQKQGGEPHTILL